MDKKDGAVLVFDFHEIFPWSYCFKLKIEEVYSKLDYEIHLYQFGLEESEINNICKNFNGKGTNSILFAFISMYKADVNLQYLIDSLNANPWYKNVPKVVFISTKYKYRSIL